MPQSGPNNNISTASGVAMLQDMGAAILYQLQQLNINSGVSSVPNTGQHYSAVPSGSFSVPDVGHQNISLISSVGITSIGQPNMSTIPCVSACCVGQQNISPNYFYNTMCKCL